MAIMFLVLLILLAVLVSGAIAYAVGLWGAKESQDTPDSELGTDRDRTASPSAHR